MFFVHGTQVQLEDHFVWGPIPVRRHALWNPVLGWPFHHDACCFESTCMFGQLSRWLDTWDITHGKKSQVRSSQYPRLPAAHLVKQPASSQGIPHSGTPRLGRVRNLCALLLDRAMPGRRRSLTLRPGIVPVPASISRSAQLVSRREPLSQHRAP